MFDIGFSELMVIAVVALIVIGPERLPKVARTLGHLFGRMQRYVNDVKSDISREMELDELRKLQTTVQDAARSFEQSVTQEVNVVDSELRKIAQEANPMPALADSPLAHTSDSPAVAAPAIADLPPAHTSESPVVDALPEPTHSVDAPLTPSEASAQLKLDIDAPLPSPERR